MRRKDKNKIYNSLFVTCISFAVSSGLIAFSISRNDYVGFTLGLTAYGLTGILALLSVAKIFAVYIKDKNKKDKIITNESK